MKTQKEIEQLAEKWFNEEFLFKNRFYTNSKELRKGYENGYTQCQEDMTDEITQLKKDIQKLTFMIDNGLGFEDMKNDIDKYPH